VGNLHQSSGSFTVVHVLQKCLECTRLVRIVRDNANQGDVTATRDAFTATLVPLPVGFLTFSVAVEGEFAVVAGLEGRGGVVAVSAGGWRHSG
jgi:hypothetical protein